MKKEAKCLSFIVVGMICFYLAFRDSISETLGVTLAIIGVVSFGIGFYKSWKNGILSSILEIFNFWP